MWQDFADKFSVRYHKDSVWRREQLIGSVINDLNGETFQGKTIGADYYYRSIMQYHRLKDGTFPYVNTYGFPQKYTGFLLVAKDQKKMVPSNFERFTVLDELFVYRNKAQTQKHIIAHDSIAVGVAANGYKSLLKTETDARQLAFKLKVAPTTSNHKNSSVFLCTAINDENGEKLFWWSEPLNHHFYAFAGDALGFEFSTDSLPDGHKSISVFLWNMSDETIDTVDADIFIYETENWHENNG